MISPSAHLKNLPFAAGELGLINMKFNFLTRTATENQKFILDVKQVESNSGKIIGGERYEINKKIPDRNLFMAVAGGDQTIQSNEQIILQAQPIGESAQYNWYDQHGALLHTGMTYSYQSDSSAVISLEVIADIDGYKDYHDISVVVQAHSLTSIVPNPSSGSSPIQVSYDIDPAQATGAYLQIVEATSGSIHVVPLNLFADQVTVSTNLIGQGNFSVLLVVDGIVVDQLNLLIL